MNLRQCDRSIESLFNAWGERADADLRFWQRREARNERDAYHERW
jgi:hypothetical protein